MKIGCIILAAGRSRRMGFPKSLLEINGRSSVSVIVETLRSTLVADSIVLVTNTTDAPRLQHLQDLQHFGEDLGHHNSVQLVINPDSDSGRTGSLQLGLNSLTPEFDGVWVWPVDTPCVQPGTLRTLRKAFEQLGRSGRVVPTTVYFSSPDTARPLQRHQSVETATHRRGGHPILIGAEWWGQIHRMGRDQPLRDLFRIDPDRILRIEVDDPAILWNLNTPLDVERLLGRPARPWELIESS